MTEEFSINDYKTEAIRITMKPSELTTLYSYATLTNLSTLHNVVFRPDSILVAIDYVDYVKDILDRLDITPELERNREWYGREK